MKKKHSYKSIFKAFSLSICSLLISMSTYAQISGKVVDESETPLVDVYILNKNNTQGATTDDNGKFIIKGKIGDTLFFSLVGFADQNVKVTSKTLVITMKEGVDLEEVVLIGSRNKSRTATETPLPIDVLDVEDLKTSAPQVTVNEILNYAAPSFTSNAQTISDGTDHIAPASLRGLGPDQVLVLINGKRRHKTALVNVNGTFGRGSVGTDLSTIPTSAIKRIEILRDGAAAQYGSDAIAGVINIVLKQDTGKLKVDLTSGINMTSKISPDKTYDGEKLNLGLNYGIPLGNKGGYVNFTGTFDFRGETNRMQEWKGTIFNKYNTLERLLASDGKDSNNLENWVNNVGTKTTEADSYEKNIVDLVNPYLSQLGIDYSSNTLTDAQKVEELRGKTASGLGNLASDNTEAELAARGMKRSDFNMRVGQSRLRAAQFWGNMNLPIDANTSIYAFGGISYKNGNAAGFYRLPNQSRTFTSVYPNGFLPNINSNISDRALTIGIKGKVGEWDVDFSNTYGINRFDYIVTNSANASLLRSTPSSAYSGGFSFSENTTNLNVSHYYDSILEGFNVAFGTEYRLENYEIFAGEELSYSQYNLDGNIHDPTNSNSKVAQTFYYTSHNSDNDTFSASSRPGGIQVFPGFKPENEVNAFRNAIAGYLDLEMDFTKRYMLGVALRYENYSDFGNVFTYKISTRRKISKNFNLRAGLQSGFRAPSLHQIHYSAVNTLFVRGIPNETGTFPNTSRIAKILGIGQLKEETSFGYTFGLTGNIPTAKLKITLDAYRVNIDDRIVLTGTFTSNNNAELEKLFAQANASKVTFFANTVNTLTQGLDIVIDHNLNISSKTRLVNTLSFTASQTTIEKVNIPTAIVNAGLSTTYFDDSTKGFIEYAVPTTKGNLSHSLIINKWNLFIRNAYFGEVKHADNNIPANVNIVMSPKVITDLSVGFSFTKKSKLSLGVNNLLDIYPDEMDVSQQGSGRFIYSRRSTQFGINGRHIFARLNITF